MAQLRLSPSGPVIAGDNVGDVLIWDGDEWIPGPQTPGSSSAFHARPFELDEAIDALALQPQSVLEFTAEELSAGQALFVQSVVQVSGVNDGALTFELWSSTDGVTFAPFWQAPAIDVGFSEGATLPFPIQGETPAVDGTTPLYVGVAIGKTGTLTINSFIAHIQAQPFTPIPD